MSDHKIVFDRPVNAGQARRLSGPAGAIGMTSRQVAQMERALGAKVIGEVVGTRDEEAELIAANQPAVTEYLKQKRYKLAPFIKDGHWALAADQIEKHRRRKKYRRRYDRHNSGIRNPERLVRPAGRWVWR